MEWIDKSEYSIDRIPEINFAVIRDYEGNELFSFRLPVTDQQIEDCIRVANIAYRDGHREGQNVLRMGLKDMLGINSPC